VQPYLVNRIKSSKFIFLSYLKCKNIYQITRCNQKTAIFILVAMRISDIAKCQLKSIIEVNKMADKTIDQLPSKRKQVIQLHKQRTSAVHDPIKPRLANIRDHVLIFVNAEDKEQVYCTHQPQRIRPQRLWQRATSGDYNSSRDKNTNIRNSLDCYEITKGFIKLSPTI
jgi:hypothetical protein